MEELWYMSPYGTVTNETEWAEGEFHTFPPVHLPSSAKISEDLLGEISISPDKNPPPKIKPKPTGKGAW